MKKLFKNKHFNLLIKGGIIVLLAGSLYRQLPANENLFDLWEKCYYRLEYGYIFYLAGVLLLMPVNWLFETLKWRRLIRQFSRISFWQTYKAVLSGLTISLFTPNRIGEYAGRILLVDAKHNWKAVVASLVGSLCQLLVLLGGGILGFGYFLYNYLERDLYFLQSFFTIGGVLVVLFGLGFFRINMLLSLARRIPLPARLKPYLKHLEVLKTYSGKDLMVAATFALVRYLTYSCQYYLILRFFGVVVSPAAAFSGIATIFLIQTSIPLPPLMGLFARGEIALFVWSEFNADPLSILGASYGLFIINLSIPAFIGMVIILKINILKSLGYENISD